MARARNIKPGLFKNEILGVADPLYTLLFEGLWLLADRNGRLEDRPLRIKAEIFPYREGIDMDAMLNWLASEGFITRYTADGVKCICIENFGKHQNPHKNEPESVLPSPESLGGGTDTFQQATESFGSASDTVIVTSEEIGTSSEKIGTTRADSLIPDSLIPDTGYLIPEDTPDGVFVASDAADAGTRAGTSSAKPSCPHQQIIGLYHELLPANPAIRDWTDARAQHLRTRWNEDAKRQTLDWWRKFFGYIGQSAFLTGRTSGRGGKPFTPGLDWIVKAENFAKIREGRFHEQEVEA